MEAALDAGADDIADDGGTWHITCEPGMVEAGPRGARSGGHRRRRPPSRRWSPRRPCRWRLPRTPRRCCGSSTRSRRTTTSRTSTATSTSPRASSKPWTPEMALGVGDPPPTSRSPAPAGAATRCPTTGARPVVLAFYPGDDTPVCTKQLTSYTGDIAPVRGGPRPGLRHQPAVDREPRALRREVRLHRSRSWPTSTRRWPAAYGTLGPLGFPRRSAFVIDADGDHPLRPPLGRRPHVPADGRAGRGRPPGVLRRADPRGRFVRLEPLGLDHADGSRRGRHRGPRDLRLHLGAGHPRRGRRLHRDRAGRAGDRHVDALRDGAGGATAGSSGAPGSSTCGRGDGPARTATRTSPRSGQRGWRRRPSAARSTPRPSSCSSPTPSTCGASNGSS